MARFRLDRFSRRQRRDTRLLAGAVVLLVVVGMAATGLVTVEVTPRDRPQHPHLTPPTRTAPTTTSAGTGQQPPGATRSTTRVSRPSGSAPRPSGAQQPPARATAPPTTNPPTAAEPPGALVRVRVRPAGLCLEVLAGLPPVRNCRGGNR